MLMDAVEFPRAANPYYPLPPDYPDLSLAGQCLARKNAACLSGTPELNVVAWAFFRKYYLESLPSGVWYKPPLYPNPPCHYAYVHDIHQFPRVVKVFPRSFAKTTLMREVILRWAYTNPFFKVLVIKSRDDFVKEDFQSLQYQMEHNPRLRDDFGTLKPKRGDGIWSQSRMFLSNGFSLVGRSVMSSTLGLRPNIWILDDAEFDPAMQIAPTSLTEQLRYMLFQHLEPMLDEGCVGVLQGTLLSRKTLLYEAATAGRTSLGLLAPYHPASQDTGGGLDLAREVQRGTAPGATGSSGPRRLRRSVPQRSGC